MTNTLQKTDKKSTKDNTSFYHLVAKSDVDHIHREEIFFCCFRSPRAALQDTLLWSNVAAETISNWLHKQSRIEKTIIKHVVKNLPLDDKPLQNYFGGNRS